MTHARIFDNPKGSWLGLGYPPLTLTGALGDYTSGAAYEGRLDIGGALGGCTAWLEAGTLPGGHAVSVDAAEVVIAWPAYAAGTTAVPNGGFESGDTGWDKGLGWTIGVNDAYAGVNSARFDPSVRGNSRIWSTELRACAPAQSVTASCQVQQGASESGHAGAWVILTFLDAAGVELSTHEGNRVMSGSNGEWHASSVTIAAPVGTAFARIGAEATRNRESRALWVDAFGWDLAAGDAAGTAGTAPYSITIGVRDSTGRTAHWTGTIEEITSVHYSVYVGHSVSPYGVTVIDQDDLSKTSLVTGIALRYPQFTDDGLYLVGMGVLYPTKVEVATGIATALTGATSHHHVLCNATHVIGLQFSPSGVDKLSLADGTLTATYTPSSECAGNMAWNAGRTKAYMSRYTGAGFTTLTIATDVLTNYTTGNNSGRGIAVRASDEHVFVTGAVTSTPTYGVRHYTADGTVLGHIALGQEVQNPTISPNGEELWVPSYGSNKVFVLNITGGGAPTLSATITVGNNPNGVSFSPDGRYAYVTCGASSHSTRIIDVATRLVVSIVSTPNSPCGSVATGT